MNFLVFPEIKANDICVKLSDITITKVQYRRYFGIFLDDLPGHTILTLFIVN